LQRESNPTHGRHLTGHVQDWLRGCSRRFAHVSHPLDPEEQIRDGTAPRYRCRPLPLGFYPQELLRHRVDLGEICRDLLIAAALTSDRMEAAARECPGRARAAKMDYRGKVPLLLRVGGRLWRARENRRDFAVQKHRRELDSAAR
jgi:hypothetical protein